MSFSQWHYVGGWTIVLVAHNWPVLVTLALSFAAAVATWRRPTRRRVALLYGCLLLGLAYEYHKHIGPTLQEAANYLLMFELLRLNRPVWLLVGPIATALILGLSGAFWAYACWPRAAQPRPERARAAAENPRAARGPQ